jgi:O-antigen ligase
MSRLVFVNEKLLMFFVAILGFSIFTSVALTNLAVLGLLLLAPFAWHKFLNDAEPLAGDIKLFLGLVLSLCMWDVFTNLQAGYEFTHSLKALLHDMRTFGFIVVLWAVFVNQKFARLAFWVVCSTVVTLVTINLFLMLIGYMPQGKYFPNFTPWLYGMSHMSHMYAQALVGLIFVLAQMWLQRPNYSWRLGVPIFLLLASLIFASERRTGWVLLVAGLLVWCMLNAKTFVAGKARWWLLFLALGVVVTAANSNVLHRGVSLALVEFNQYIAMTPQERSAAIFGSVSIRMQFANTAWETIKQNNWWLGVGSIGFPQAYQAAAASLDVKPQSWATYNWGNPHNEYLYMLATKGIVGLFLYLLVFVQACRVAWLKSDDVQRIGLVMFVFLFLLSITTNSMMIDMEEGHFSMLMLLIFLAPRSLDLMHSNLQAREV